MLFVDMYICYNLIYCRVKGCFLFLWLYIIVMLVKILRHMFKRLFFLVSFNLIVFADAINPDDFSQENSNGIKQIQFVVTLNDGNRYMFEGDVCTLGANGEKNPLVINLQNRNVLDCINKPEENSKNRYYNSMKKVGNLIWSVCRGTFNCTTYVLDHPYVSLVIGVMIYRYLPGKIRSLVYNLVKGVSVNFGKFIVTVIGESLNGTFTIAKGTFGKIFQYIGINPVTR